MLRNYIKIAWKVLLRRKFFTFISLFGISFTLMILMVAVALVDHLFEPAKPGSNLDRTLYVMRVELTGGGFGSSNFPSYYFLSKYLRPLKTPELVSIHSMPSSLSHPFAGGKLSLQQKYTDAAFWEICQFDFLEGGAFDQQAVDNVEYVAVISETAQRQLFGNESAMGKQVDAFGSKYRVVGVIAGQDIPTFLAYSDIFVPISTSRQDFSRQEFTGRYNAFVMAYDESDFPTIRREFSKAIAEFESPRPDEFTEIKCHLGTQADFIAGEFIGYDNVEIGGAVILTVASIAGILFMLLPTVNLVNVNLSRIVERASEIGVRKAFGASSLTLVGQFVVENVILTLIGGAIGLILATAALQIITSSGVMPYGDFGLNLRVFFASLGICLFFGLVSGVYPAFKMSRLHPVDALRGAEL